MGLPKHAIIVAGGQGARMQLSIPKQFVLMAGKPLLMHTLQVFDACDLAIRIVVVLPETEMATWAALCRKYAFAVPHEVAAGGENRSASVWQGVKQLGSQEGVVAVHDGVRPLVSPELIKRSFQQAEKHGSAVASVLLKDSIRKVHGADSKACLREQYRLIQTPQTFRVSLLRTAYETATGKVFSDDASLVEHSGHKIHLIEGEYRNLKVTTPEDLTVAAALFDQAAAR